MGGGMEGYKPLAAMIGIQCVYAGLGLFSRLALVQGMSPRVFVVYRQAIGTLLLAPFVFFSRWRNPCRTPLGIRGFWLIFLSSFIGVTANQNAYFEGLYLSSSTIASAMINLVPAITFFLAVIVGFEKVNLQSLSSNAKIIGTMICVGGAIYMTFVKGTKLLNTQLLPLRSWESAFINTLSIDNLKLGCLLLFANSCFASIWVILQVPISANCPDNLYSAFWMCLLGTIQSAIVTPVLEHDLQVWNVHSIIQVGSCFYAGLATALSFFIQTWCISVKGPLYVAMFNPLCTVITTFVAAVFLHEELYLGSLIGAVAVIIGLYIVLWGKGNDPGKIEQMTDMGKSIKAGVMDDSLEKTTCRIDLQEPFLSEK